MRHRPFTSSFALGALAFLFARETLAHRFEFVAKVGEDRLFGAEVCFFVGKSSSNPVEVFGQSDRVRCLSADIVHHMRPGIWNYYVQHSSGYVSAFPDTMTLEGDNPSPLPRELPTPLRKAGVLDFEEIAKELAEGEHFAVYISNVTTANRLATIHPLPNGSTRMLVPAGERVVPLILNHGKLVRVGDVQEVAPDKVIKVRSFATTKPNTADIVSWIKVDYSMLDRVRNAALLSLPFVELTSHKGTPIRPLFPLRAGASNELALQIFKSVPYGRYKVTIRGDTWETAILDVTSSKEALVSMTTEPLLAVPAGQITLRWRLPQTPSQLSTATASCDESTSSGSTASALLSVLTCAALSPNQPPETISLTSCRALADWKIAGGDDHGEQILSGLPARTYLAVLRLHGMQPILKALYVAPGDRIKELIEPTFSTIFGRLTRGGAPLYATIRFATGTTVSDRATGDYTVVVAESPGGDPITVKPCDGGAPVLYQPKAPIPLNSAYDIALENTAIHAVVQDKTSGARIEGARVEFSLYRDNESSVVDRSGTAKLTAKDGSSSFQSLPSAVPMVVCARKSGYEDFCTTRFALRKDESRNITIQLNPARVFEGRVVGAPSLKNALLFWADRAGNVTEMAEVNTDGRFAYRAIHGDTEAAILISSNAPLHVFSGKATGETPLELRISQRPIRSFTVSTSRPDQDVAYVGLWIGGLPVPSDVLTRHLSFRGLPTMIIRGDPMVIRHIVETGPIEVTLGPHPRMIPKGLPGDWFSVPTYARSFPLKALGRADRIDF